MARDSDELPGIKVPHYSIKTSKNNTINHIFAYGKNVNMKFELMEMSRKRQMEKKLNI